MARKSVEQIRLENLLDRKAAALQRKFQTFVSSVKSDAAMKQVRQLLAAGRTHEALDVLDRHVISYSNTIAQEFNSSAQDEIRGLVSAEFLNRLRGEIGISFDPTHPRAVALIRAHRLEFIQQFTNQQRAAVRQAIARAFGTGQGITPMANAFRNAIGLTQQQEAMVASYQNLLEEGSRRALDRTLRDRRYDRTVERIADENDVLDASQITRMVDRYRENMIAHRAKTIARTESLRILSEARQEALQQITEEVGIQGYRVARTWNATKDARTRDSHTAMDGQTVIGIDEPFLTPDGEYLMYPGDPNASPGEVINCRCVVTHDILPPE